jgi:uncharacterized protein YndB with AHSA1/START domain
MTTVTNAADVPVRKTITVNAPVDHAFAVFTAGFDTWWPRTHHIGKSPMKRAIVEGRTGGRCYTEQTDGTDCDWGSVLVWDPPHRLVLAWQINSSWQFEPDLAKASEVEIRFTSLMDGQTRVDLEHRHFDRLGAGGEAMRAMVGSDNGWSGTLQLFSTAAERR